jgi:4-hydroxy-3-methylbut-2-enyl diphosphate reductase
MRVIRADALGMCFGVRDALALLEAIEAPERVTIHGELVHNPEVVERLAARGFAQTSEHTRAGATPATPEVLITAHGVSDAERARLGAAGARLIDATCPLVRRAHRAALALARQGYFVVVVGKPGHVEVEGLTGDLRACAVVPTPAQARWYPARRIGVVCQTTTPPELASAVFDAIARQNPQADEVRFVDTVCRPTKERQHAVERLLDRVEAVVVVGGRNSNNTRALLERCRARGVPAWQVERAEQLDPAWFAGRRTVGLTAGTSTLDATIDAVEEALVALEAPARREAVGIEV